ncbi:MAG: hypothetical protein IKI83_06375 [Prevotella sp.]|nr:hypothetical protein [Prevotella sp.]
MKYFISLLFLLFTIDCFAITDVPAMVIKPGTKYYIYNTYYNKYLCTRNDKEGFAGLSDFGLNDSTDYIFTAIASNTDGYYWLQQEKTGKYLQASNASNDTWNVWLTSNLNDSYDSFKWRLEAGTSGSISNKRSTDKYLGVDTGAESLSYIGVYYDKASSERTIWLFFPVDDKNDNNSQLNEYGKWEYFADSIRNDVLVLDSAIDYHVTNAIPMGNCQIQLNHEDAWLILENVRPSEVVNKYLSNISIHGEVAKNGYNCRVAIYLDGAVVIPQNQSTYLPFTGYEEPSCMGDNYPMFTGANSLGDTDLSNNRISSFVLKRGYMATVATSKDGTGYSRVFVADHQDLIVTELPTALNRRISYVNIKKWNYVSKKGWSSTEGQGAINTEGALVKTTWFYTWSADKNNQLDMEYVPMNTHQYWPSISSITAKTESTHMLSINEPDHPEQHTNCSCNENKHGTVGAWTATTWTPRYQTTGMRIGSPCPTDASWLKEYIGHIDDMAYRCDFVTFHAYWGTNEAANIDSWYNQLKAIYDATGRPIWLTEFNNGASWTKETKPSYSANGEKIAKLVQMLENAPFIERYCIYNWDDWHLAVLTWDNDKKSWWVNPAGQAYRDVKPHFAYNAKMQKIPNWWGFNIKSGKTEFALTSLTWVNSNHTAKLSVRNENVDQTDVLTIEAQKEDGTWQPFRSIDERELFDNNTFSVILDANTDVLLPYYLANPSKLTLRMTIKDIKGKTATSETFSKDWPTWMIQAMGINQIANEDNNTARRFDLNGRIVSPNTKGIQIVKDQTKSIKKIINK